MAPQSLYTELFDLALCRTATLCGPTKIYACLDLVVAARVAQQHGAFAEPVPPTARVAPESQ